MSILHLKSNLLLLFQECSEKIKQEGKLWYPAAQVYFCDLAKKYNLREDTILGIVAALSPFVSWQTQLKQTETFLLTQNFPGFKSNILAARRILNGVPPGFVLKGQKVSVFFANLMGNTSHVTLDRHAISAAVGRKIGQHEKLSRTMFNQIRTAYMEAADMVKPQINVRDFQAIIWNWWKSK